MGVFEKIKSGSSTSTGSGIFAKIKKKDDENDVESIRQGQSKFGTVSLDPSKSSVMQQINKINSQPQPVEEKQISNYEDRKNDPSRKIPVLGSVFKMLDKLSDTKTQHVIADVGQTLYTPGAGAANVAGFTGAVGRKLFETAPKIVGEKLAGTAASRVAQAALKEAATGVPLGVGQYQSMGGDNIKEALKQGALGAALGGGLGALGGSVVESVAKIKKDKLAASFDKMFPAYEQAAKNRNVRELTKAKPLDLPVLGLPEPKSAIMERELNRRSVLPANTDVIHGQGELFKAEPLGLPNGNFTAPTRLKVSNPTDTLDYVMKKIKPEVLQTIEAPARRDLLIQYIQKNTQIPVDEIHNMKMTDLQELGQNIQQDLHSKMPQIATQVAAKYGHDLPSLLEGQAPNLRAQLANDTQSQVYGVQPPKVGIQKPDFNITHNADAAMPVTKIKRLSELRQEVAATAEAKPKVDPLKGTAVKKEAVKPSAQNEAKTFKTSKGSTYTIGENGSTQRDKSLHAGHETTDVGLKRPSEQTVYVDKSEASRVGSHGALNKDAKPRIVIRDDGLHLVSWNSAENRWGRMGSKIDYTTTPEVGKSPIEFYKTQNEDGLGRVSISYHAGNDITEIDGKTLTKVEVVGKPEPLKPKAEVNRTFTPTQRVSGIRANYQNQLKNGNLSPELKKRISNTDKTYEKVTNEDSVKKANEAIQNISVAESKFHGNKEYSAAHVATGYRLIQELDSKAASETNTVLREAYHQRSLNVANKLAKDLTEAGQTVQAANVLAKLSPEGQLLNLTRQAEKNGKSVSVADKVKFQELAVKVQKNAGMGVRSNQFTEILNRAAKGERLTSDDVKKMGDYLASAEKSAKPRVVKIADDLPNELKEPRKRDRIVSYLDDAEQAALARIKARKNNLNSLPIGEWADHAIVVSSQIAKGTIKAATHIEDLVKLFGEEIRPVASQVFQKAQSLVKSVSPGISANDMTKANKAFERISGQAKEMNLQEKIVEKYVKENPKVSPKDIDTLRELAKNVTQLSSDEGVKADIAMQKILNSYEKSTSWDKVKAIRYMAMLLNSGTQLVNAASGPIMATMGHAADVFGTMLDIAVHHALGKPRSVTLYGSNPLRFMADYFKHLVKTGAPAGWHGVSPGGIQNAGEIRGLTFKSDYNPLNWAERTLGAVAKGTDYAAYKTIFDSEIRKSGFLDAINSGIKRSDRAAIKAHVEKFVNEPSEKALLDADRIGKNTTFQRSDSIGGQTANFLNGGSGKVKKYVSPVVNAVIPFVRTPINIASTAVTMTPAGILKGLWQLTSKSEASQREAIRTLSLGVTGTFGTSALGYYLSNIGIITGANDSGDKDVDAIKDQAGQGKYRFNTSALKRYLTVLLDGDGADAAEKAAKYQEGDHAFDYNKFQPIAFPLAIGASLGKSEGKPLVGRLSSAGTEAYGSLFGMSTLKGVQDVFQPQYSGTQGEKQIGVASRLAESFFKSFSPSMLAQEARRQDPTARKTPYNNGFTNDLKGYFQSRTPGLSQSLPANKTTLGMDKMNATGFSGQYINPYKSEIAAYSQAAVIISELIDRTGDTSLAPSAPSKKVSGKDRKTGDPVEYAIPQDRYEQLQEELGQAIIVKIMAINQNDSDIKKVEKIKKIYEDTRKIEMDKVKKEFGIKVTK